METGPHRDPVNVKSVCWRYAVALAAGIGLMTLISAP